MRKLNINSQALPNFKRLDSSDGTIYGLHNCVESVNPYKCRFVATYPDGKDLKGGDLFTTGWDFIPQGLSELRYELSTGHVIKIPKYKAYKPLIEVSLGMDGSRIFHSINVNCLAENEVVIYRIILRQDKIKPYKIGDIIMGRSVLPNDLKTSWKYTS